MAIDFLIGALPRPVVSHHVEVVVRRTFREVGRKGHWDVVLLPSDCDGRWDLGLSGPTGRQFISFMAPVDELPARVAEHVRLMLQS